jgi:hypothetical protein
MDFVAAIVARASGSGCTRDGAALTRWTHSLRVKAPVLRFIRADVE